MHNSIQLNDGTQSSSHRRSSPHRQRSITSSDVISRTKTKGKKLMKMFKLNAAVALAATAMISQSSATTIYTSQATFLANTQPGYYLETFDSLPQFTFIPPTPPLSFSKNGFSYTASSTRGFFNVGPSGDTWLSLGFPIDTIVFSFTSNNVTAVGGYFFGTDLNGSPTNATLTATLNNGSTFSITGASSTSFIGFTTFVPITSLTVAVANPDPSTGPFVTVNNFITGASVPESGSTLPLISIALASIGFLRRKLVA